MGCAKLSETWLDDPANVDPSSLRARARRLIDDGGDAGPAPQPADATELLRASTVGWAGTVQVGFEALRGASSASRRRFLNAALVCAGGGRRPPRGAALDRLWDRLATGDRVTATLAGARVDSDGQTVAITRDDGAVSASAWCGGVFDGRYLVDDVRAVFALRGHMAELDGRQRERLKSLSPTARRALPAIRRDDGSAACPLLDGRGQSLVAERLAAACGAIVREASIRRVGETPLGVLNRLASIERSVHEPA